MKAASSSQLPEQTYSTQFKPQKTTSATITVQFYFHSSQNLHKAVLNYAYEQTLEAWCLFKHRDNFLFYIYYKNIKVTVQMSVQQLCYVLEYRFDFG